MNILHEHIFELITKELNKYKIADPTISRFFALPAPKTMEN
ncbi:hypothetical protein C4K23_4861 [Pseudomonas chlororaphis]|nr:hypothetical protein C4K23_4861 [Pseudomonas chlororaphis]